jgi:hypothetical protein
VVDGRGIEQIDVVVAGAKRGAWRPQSLEAISSNYANIANIANIAE